MRVPWAYDMQIVDERLTVVEDKVEQIMELLKGISNDLSKGENIGIKEEINKGSKRQTVIQSKQQMEGLSKEEVRHTRR